MTKDETKWSRGAGEFTDSIIASLKVLFRPARTDSLVCVVSCYAWRSVLAMCSFACSLVYACVHVTPRYS